MSPRQSQQCLFAAILCLCCLAQLVQGFATSNHQKKLQSTLHHRRTPSAALLRVAASNDVQDDVEIEFDDEDDDGTEEKNDNSPSNAKGNRWKNLDPKYKQYLIKRGQERAIANKEKREPTMDKKRKVLMFMKEQQRQKKKETNVYRPISFKDRKPLADVVIGEEVNGTVISLTNFGAYVDIGTECDGLLHISQISQQVFVEHPRQVLTPGDTVTVRVRSTNPDQRKLHLTMLPLEALEEEQEELATMEERIPLEEIRVDDELWGSIKRVTDFGAYVEVGAVVDGWLHFMDHPLWDGSAHPSDFMQRHERVRVWVSDMDRSQNRLKLTANRPAHLPGPRREF